MSNPWASSFDEYRQTIIGEGKGKKEPRWQDDDCDGKWYEKSDTDGKISKREKKAKAKHYNEDAEYGYDKDGDSLNPKDIKKKNEKDPNGEAKKQEEEDPRGMATKINLVRNKLRAMGLKMSQELEGETIEESEKVAQGALKKAQKLGADRRKREGVNRGMGKNERAGYKKFINKTLMVLKLMSQK